MSLTTVYTLQNANFSGQGLPNIFPFVAQLEAEYAYDFRARANRLADVTGRHADLAPYRNDIVGGKIKVPDPSVVVDQDAGAGIRIELGYLQTDVPTAPIPIGGAVKFSMLVVGGNSGFKPPADKLNASSDTAVLFDFGSMISSSGFALEVNSVTVTSRVRSGAANLSSSPVGAVTKKFFQVLTFDGVTWTLHNKTLGTKVSKTNAELGIVASIPVSGLSTREIIGHAHPTTTLFSMYPAMYQLAKWSRVLSQVEIDQQYAKTLANFPGLML